MLAGHLPTFQAYQAPTEHPLYVALCALLGLLGTAAAERALVLVTVACLVLLVWGVYRLGARLFGAWPGVAAAAFVATSSSFALYAARAYVDLPFLALIVWAAVAEVEAPRGQDRGLLVLGMLALAGLLRPEAWLLAGAYWAWRARGWTRGRVATGALLVAAAPMLWGLGDLAVTGDPLYSLHATRDLADELGRTRGAGALPGAFASFLAATVRAPVAVAGAVGAVLAWRRLGAARLAVPGGLFCAGVVTFTATGLAGLSILPRYLTVPAISLCVLAGYAWLGFTRLPPGRARRRWARASAVAAVAGAGFAVLSAPSLGRLTGELRFVGDAHADLAALLRAPAVRAGLRCGPLTLPNYRLVPDARWLLDAPRWKVGARSARRHAYGVEVFALGDRALLRFGFAQGASPRTNVPDPGYVPAARTARFAAYVRCR